MYIAFGFDLERTGGVNYDSINNLFEKPWEVCYDGRNYMRISWLTKPLDTFYIGEIEKELFYRHYYSIREDVCKYFLNKLENLGINKSSAKRIYISEVREETLTKGKPYF